MKVRHGGPQFIAMLRLAGMRRCWFPMLACVLVVWFMMLLGVQPVRALPPTLSIKYYPPTERCTLGRIHVKLKHIWRSIRTCAPKASLTSLSWIHLDGGSAYCWDDARMLQHSRWTMELVMKEAIYVQNGTREFVLQSWRLLWLTWLLDHHIQKLGGEPMLGVPTWLHWKSDDLCACSTWAISNNAYQETSTYL